MINIQSLFESISAVCPIDGLSIGSIDDKGTWHIVFSASATELQKAAAASVLASFDLLQAPSAPLMVAAAFNLHVVDGDIPGIDGPFNIAAAAYADVGQYWLFFSQSQPGAGYFADMSGDAPVIAMTYGGEDYCVIEVKESIGGNYVDATTLNIKIYRIS